MSFIDKRSPKANRISLPCLCLAFFAVLPLKDSMSIERSNLLSMMKLSVKVLIQSSLSLGRTLDSDYPPLQQFFVVLEHCLKHGLKGDTIETDFSAAVLVCI